MKVLFVILSLERGGSERVVSLLSQEMQKKHEVKIAVFDAKRTAYDYGGRLIDLGLPLEVWGFYRKVAVSFLAVFRLIGLFRSERPDHILTFNEAAGFSSTVAAAVTGTLERLQVSIHGHPIVARRRLVRYLMRLFYRFPRRVVAISEGVLLSLVRVGVPKSKLVFVPNPAPQNTPDKLMKPPQAPERYILGVGRLVRVKGYERLLRAFSEIDDISVKLVILGEGSERGMLESLSQELGIEKRVLMPGTVEDPSAWYQHAICFVLSSRHEGWPMVLFEAMVNRCPIVSFNSDFGPTEIITHEDSGLLVEEGDISGLTGAINRVISSPKLRRKLVDGGLRKAKSPEFRIENVATRWLSF